MGFWGVFGVLCFLCGGHYGLWDFCIAESFCGIMGLSKFSNIKSAVFY